MYVQLPEELLVHVFSKLYFPYFGSLTTASYATFGINCGPGEANFDSLGTNGIDWNVMHAIEATDRLIVNPSLTERPKFYFRFGQLGTPQGLGHPNPSGFWSFFNCAGAPEQNPIHRDHYFNGSLVHIDGVPWATRQKWSTFKNHHPLTAEQMAHLGLASLHQTLENSPEITKIFVRGRTASAFLEATNFGLELTWVPIAAQYWLGTGIMSLNDGRTIDVRAINQFHSITAEAAPAVIGM